MLVQIHYHSNHTYSRFLLWHRGTTLHLLKDLL